MPNQEPSPKRPPLVGIVGVCASGKSTLINSLVNHGFNCRHIAQEHSYVPTMWQQLTNPDCLVFLKVSYPVTKQRRNLDWTLEEYNEELYRLRHAYAHADLIVDTDGKTPEEVKDIVIAFLHHSGF